MAIRRDTVTAEEFLVAFCSELPDGYSDLVAGQAGWTDWMSRHLHLVQRRLGLGCCCGYRAADVAGPGLSTNAPDDHVDKEWLFDFTWYNRWDHHAQPCVLIEHENQHSEAGFMRDQWKLMFGWAPLRVMIGYTPEPGGYRARLDTLNHKAEALGWRFPTGPESVCEDLALFGHRNMTPRGFRVLRRRHGASRWEDTGELSGFVPPAT